MKTVNLAVAASAAGAAAMPPSHSSHSWVSRMADSYIRRGVEPDFGYSVATLYTGMEATVAVTKNESIVSWYKDHVDAVLTDDGEIVDWEYDFYSLDEYRIGNNFLWWYDRTGDDKYKSAAAIIRAQLNRHPRNPEGGFWHRDPTYPDQMWLDGIFMADSFYSRWTAEFDAANDTAWDDIALQYDLVERHCRNHTTNLLVHGYDASKTAVWADPVTGAAPLVWGRAVGWYFMSLLESISVFPEGHPGRARLVRYFVTLAAGLKAAHERDDGWWLILTEPYPGEEGNYIESSAHAMFTYGLLRGIRMGLLSENRYGRLADGVFKEMIRRFVTTNADGTLNYEQTVQVGSLSGNGTYEYYIGVPTVDNDLRGGGAFLLAAADWELRQ